MQAQRLAKKSESSRNRAQILRPRFSTHRERTSSFLLLFLITIADLTGGSERFFNIFPYILHWRFKNSSAFFVTSTNAAAGAHNPINFTTKTYLCPSFFYFGRAKYLELFVSRRLSRHLSRL